MLKTGSFLVMLLFMVSGCSDEGKTSGTGKGGTGSGGGGGNPAPHLKEKPKTPNTAA